MTEPITDEYLDRLLELEAEATTGEARAATMRAEDWPKLMVSLETDWLGGPDAVRDEVCHVLIASGDELLSLCVTGNGPKRKENAQLLASARNALRPLVEEVRRLRKERDEAAWLLSWCDPRTRNPFEGPSDWASRYDRWFGGKGDR